MHRLRYTMPRKRPTTTARRRDLLARLDGALAESIDTRRKVANRLERDTTDASWRDGVEPDDASEGGAADAPGDVR